MHPSSFCCPLLPHAYKHRERRRGRERDRELSRKRGRGGVTIILTRSSPPSLPSACAACTVPYRTVFPCHSALLLVAAVLWYGSLPCAGATLPFDNLGGCSPPWPWYGMTRLDYTDPTPIRRGHAFMHLSSSMYPSRVCLDCCPMWPYPYPSPSPSPSLLLRPTTTIITVDVLVGLLPPIACVGHETRRRRRSLIRPHTNHTTITYIRICFLFVCFSLVLWPCWT